MAQPHASVKYVEPNYVYSGLTAAANDGNRHDRAPDLEDYCIGLDIVVELSSRHKSLRDMPAENKVIVMSYEDRKGQKGTVRFMSGTRIGGYRKNDSGAFTPNLYGQNVLTSYYADMHITDLVDYGTTEMVGIKSVDIDYNSTCVPVINIKFTDVRGMSIFQPSELNDDKSFNGIRGFSEDNIAQSFFHAFFTLPLPKFTVILKGFYGSPVSYQVMCDKFDTAFDSKNGYFDVSTRFIGYAYSFMADVSFNALLAAPYSDFKGSEYWDTQVREGRFKVTDKNGAPVEMPRLYDIRKTVETLIVDSDDASHLSTIEEEVNTHEIEIQSLTDIKRQYRTWYDALYTLACNKYGEDYCYRLGGNTPEEDYRYVIIFTNGKNISGADLSEEYKGYDKSFRTQTENLMNAVNQLNKSGNIYRKLDNVKENFKYPRVRVFNEIWLNDKTGLFMMNGFQTSNILPRKETINAVFGESTYSQQKILKKLYNDGKYQYIDAFVIDLDYTDVKRRINALIEDANKQISDKASERKALNRHMYDKLGWYPTIENFTKIVMAHLETLMAMMYDVVDNTTLRTVGSLGVTCGDAGVVDINRYDDYVAPFPRLTTLTTDSDGYTKSEDAWAGNFVNGEGFREVDVVNGLFNGAAKINRIEETIRKAIENGEEESNGTSGEETPSFRIPMPITPFDFFLTGNPYGDDKEAINSIEAFAGKVCIRMFDIMELSHFRSQYTDEWVNKAEMIGAIEARNFLSANRLTNPDLITALGENGTLSTADDIWNIVKGDTKEKLPWDDGNEGNKSLFYGRDNLWLSRYRVKVEDGDSFYYKGLYPVQGISFDEMKDLFGAFATGKTPVESDKVTVIDSNYNCSKDFMKFMRLTGDTTTLNTIKFTDRYQTIWDTFNAAQTSNCEEYKNVMGSITDDIKPDEKNLEDFILTSTESFSNCVGAECLLDSKGGKDIPICVSKDIMYAGKIGVNKKDYTFDGSSYANEMTERNIQSYTLTQCFGYRKDNDGKYFIDKKTSLFMIKDFYENNDTVSDNVTNDTIFSNDVLKAAFFLMGIDSINYTAIKNSISTSTFNYMPKLAALQIGAVIGTYYTIYGMTSDARLMNSDIKKKIPVPDGLSILEEAINKMSPYHKIAYVNYFKNWATNNSSKIKQLYIAHKGEKFICDDGGHYEKIFYTGKDDRRALFKETSPLIKELTNDLMSLICVVKYTVNARDNSKSYNRTDFNDGKDRDAMLATNFKINESQAKVYLNSFLKTLRAENGIENSIDGGPTTIAANPSQTSEDMKIELYRYLKQLYDKWVSCTKFDTWWFDKFFDKENRDNPLGNNFFFIDSFYNKIGDKLLINPMKLSSILKLVISSMDTNTMMYSFLAQVYGEHRCMMKCVQNFKNLSEGINNIFVPLPYESMSKPDPLPDFVVIYAYESSRNLNIANSEYKDDGFMLNDEFETPLPIKSRGDEDKYYKIPAFGVSYGRQYQNYFKSVNINMSHPVMTEQAIIAKHNILAASRGTTFKNITAQDLYDIYSNQSYTCTVEMMGCAYVQPLMYFVLLNVPFFKGSYLISKVKHKMIPGDMTTEITGVRMSKYCNKLVTDIFTDESDEMIGGGTYDEDMKHQLADTTNDCPYKVFPILGGTTGKEGVMTQAQINAGLTVMRALIDTHKLSVPLAAGIAGNISVESECNPAALNPADKGFMSGGLCQWRGGNLKSLLDNTPSMHGRIKDSGATQYAAVKSKNDDRYKSTVSKLSTMSSGSQLTYLVNSLKSKDSWVKNNMKLDKLNAIGNPEEAAKSFRENYEIGENGSERWMRANKLYNAYQEKKIKETTPNLKDDFIKLFVAAIQKSLNSTNKYAAELKVEYHSYGAVIRIDNGAENLAVLFDIILNSDEYYSHVSVLDWNINNSPSELPHSLRVMASPNVQSRRITIGNIKQTWNKLNGNECNKRFMQSLAKRYMNDKKIFGMECHQFSNALDSINEFKPADCNSLYTGTLGAGVNSNWSMAVMEMGKWYERNVHTYSSGEVNCPLIGVNVRQDCSGFVAACLKRFGVTDRPFNGSDSPGSSDYLSNRKVADILSKKGFKKMSGSNPQPFDIMAKNGHVEIYAGNSKSWGWGSCHDGKNGHPGMPSPMNKGPYSVIWRYVG